MIGWHWIQEYFHSPPPGRRGIEILYLLNIEILIYFITLLKRIQPYAHY